MFAGNLGWAPTVMSTPISVGLPDALVRYLDELVAAGEPSRGAAVTKALIRYRRQRLAEQDAEIYLATGGYPELYEWASSARALPDLG